MKSWKALLEFLLYSGSSPEGVGNASPPKLLMRYIKEPKTEGGPLNVLADYEELLKMYEEGGWQMLLVFTRRQARC